MVNIRRYAVILFLAAAYLVPLAVYVATFGWSITSEHSRWGEFGSAMAGIYAPIVALTTLVVLLAQVSLQKQMNDHESRQAHIEQAREDVEFYAMQLAEQLDNSASPGKSWRQLLHAEFQPRTDKELDSEPLRTLAADISSLAPGILPVWMAVLPILEGLTAVRHPTFEMTYQSSKAKLIALLSYETCVCLDNLHRVRTEGKTGVRYRFSSLAADRACSAQ